MQKGSATLVGLLIASIIIFFIVLAAKELTKTAAEPQDLTTLPQNTQKAVDELQKKSIQSQNPNLQ